MLLSDLYAKKYITDEMTFHDKYAFLEGVQFPSNDDIAYEQLWRVREQFPVDPKLQEIVDNLNLDMNQPIVDKDNLAADQVIQKIEDALGLWYQSKNPYSAAKIRSTISGDVLNNLEVDLEKYEQLLNSLMEVYIQLMQPNYSNNEFMKKRLEQIENAMIQIRTDIDKYKAGTFEPIGTIEDNAKGYIGKAVNLGHDLKGKYLEMAATEWLNEKLPSDIKVVDVGNITGWSYDIFGNKKSKGKALRTDIMGFDTNLAKQLKITYEVNGQTKTTSIWEMLELIEKNNGNDSISLNGTDYSQIQKALVFGAQAKSGQGQAIFNTVSASLRDVVAANMSSDYARALAALSEIAAQPESVINTKSHNYDAMFNFLLGRQLGNIIGQENNLVVTREGIQTLYEYMTKQWRENQRIVRAINRRVDIQAPDSLNEIKYAKAEERA